jgi:antitoxin component YwqK of YwqJK toxin-antitoxin module
VGKWVNFNRPRSTAEFDVTKLETSRHITKEGDTLERHLGLNYLGQVLREESWFHDKQNGLRIAYFPNGVVREIAYYLDGLPWDAISLADTTGKLYFPGTLHNGNGTMYFYDYHWSNGPVNFATYQNGHMDGPYLRQ